MWVLLPLLTGPLGARLPLGLTDASLWRQGSCARRSCGDEWGHSGILRHRPSVPAPPPAGLHSRLALARPSLPCLPARDLHPGRITTGAHTVSLSLSPGARGSKTPARNFQLGASGPRQNQQKYIHIYIF